ncbi:MAG: tetratricopeptide repeat protein [Planctomycetota bacterium]
MPMPARGETTGRGRPFAAIAPALCVFAACVLPFLGAFGADFVNWDDDLNLLRNDRFRGFDGDRIAWMFTSAHMGHWHPLTWLSFAVDHALFGLAPWGYHAHNLVLHGLTAVVYWALLLELLRQVFDDAAAARLRWLAAACALLFAVHPLRVESVAWVTERRDVLSGLFWVATLLFYLRAHRPNAAAKRRDLALAHGMLALSLGAKAWAITLPPVLLLLDVWPLRRRARGDGWARLLVEKLGFVALAVGAAVIAAAAQGESGARMSFADHSLVARCFQACYGLCFYVVKTVAPIDLSPLYPLEKALDWTEPRFVGSAAAVVAVAAVMLWRRSAPALVVLASYAAIAAPVLGFLQSGPQLVADRYTYLACLPFPVVALLWLAKGRRPGRAALGVAAIAAVLAASTALQTAVWRDSLRLWEHTLALHPESFNAHLNYGRALIAVGRRTEAIAELRRTVEIEPREWKAWYMLGNEETRARHFEAALAAHERCLALAPDYRDNLYGMALATMELRRFEDCLSWCRRVQALEPAWPHSWPLCGDALQQLGRTADARAAFEQALRLDPSNRYVRDRLAGMR